MENIYDTNDKFPFDKLKLSKPMSISSGSFLIKFAVDEIPLYIQPPKCLIKQVVIKTGKRMYCDFVFHQENEQFIRWMENLENISQKMIFDNRQQWFETELELDDIENTFTSPMKIYKSGKSYIVRTTIANRLGKPSVKIYDEDENTILFDQLKENANVMVILEVQGIRCSARSFQIDIELKQMMVLKTEDLFNTCILKKKPQSAGIQYVSEPFLVTKSNEENMKIEAESNALVEMVVEAEAEAEADSHTEPIAIISSLETNDLGKNEERLANKSNEPSSPVSDSEEHEIQKINTIPENNILLDSNELCEVEFNLDEMPETDIVSIKQRKDVYYEMYKDARQKAKVARDLALSAYLEAKRIKNTYMLDDIVNSSDEEDESDDEDEDEYAEA